MKSAGTFSIMAPRGPWLWVGAVNDRVHLDGHRVAAALTIDPYTGISINLAAVPLGSLILGWMPRHHGCTTDGDHIDHAPRCPWQYLPDRGIRINTAPVVPPDAPADHPHTHRPGH